MLPVLGFITFLVGVLCFRCAQQRYGGARRIDVRPSPPWWPFGAIYWIGMWRTAYVTGASCIVAAVFGLTDPFAATETLSTVAVFVMFLGMPPLYLVVLATNYPCLLVPGGLRHLDGAIAAEREKKLHKATHD